MLDIFCEDHESAVPLWLVSAAAFDTWSADQKPAIRAWAKTCGFTGQEGRWLRLPGADGALSGVALGLGADVEGTAFPLAALSSSLPEGDYVLKGALTDRDPALLVLGWALGVYRFDRFKTSAGDSQSPPRLVVPQGADGVAASRLAETLFWVRDLINTPANHMGPAELEAAARELAEEEGAAITVITGDDLLSHNFPLVHAVGRTAAAPPRLIDLTWGREDAPKVTLVGKGVCFDTGGLNLKPGGSMGLMKKDMGGAAHVLGLARLIMEAGLNVRLRMIVPAVENAIGSAAFRPGDILPSRQGQTVEIGNTDAEGRLILADALALADEEKPDLLINMATLTGAARSALGPDLPPFYCDDDMLAAQIAEQAKACGDPLWRLPLWQGYDSWLASKVADMNHIGDNAMAGSIIAALFLKRFVTRASAWIHLDVYAWSPKARPGQPVGAAAQGLRALYGVIKQRYG